MRIDPLDVSLLALAKSVAQEAGALIARYAADGFAVGTKSTATDMVTEADRAAARAAVGGDPRARPGG